MNAIGILAICGVTSGSMVAGTLALARSHER